MAGGGLKGEAGRFSLAYFMLFAVYGIISPYLQILVRGLGYGPAAVGLLLAFYEIVGILGPLVLARLADRYGSYRLALVASSGAVILALPFLSRGYGRHLEDHGPEAEGFRRIYFILAGYAPAAPPPHFRMALLGSEDNELPLKRIQIGNAVVMPRNLGMEMRLVKALHQGADLEEVLNLCKDFLEKMAAIKEEVGPPYHFATITSQGYRSIIL